MAELTAQVQTFVDAWTPGRPKPSAVFMRVPTGCAPQTCMNPRGLNRLKSHQDQKDPETQAAATPSSLVVNGFGTVGLASLNASERWSFQRDLLQPEDHRSTRFDVDSRTGLQANWHINSHGKPWARSWSIHRAGLRVVPHYARPDGEFRPQYGACMAPPCRAKRAG